MYATILRLFVTADVPRVPTAVERSLDLATLSHREAQQLDGQRVRIRGETSRRPGRRWTLKTLTAAADRCSVLFG
jgi:hypothetical protein